MRSGIATRIVLKNSPRGEAIGSAVLILGLTRKRRRINHRGRNSLTAKRIPVALVETLIVNTTNGATLFYFFCPECESFGKLGRGYLVHYIDCKCDTVCLVYKDMNDDQARLVIHRDRANRGRLLSTARASRLAERQ